MSITSTQKTLRFSAALSIGTALAIGLAACNGATEPQQKKSEGAFPSSGSGEVTIFNMTNYISPEALKKFTQDTGITAKVDSASSMEEMVAKVKTGSATYDVMLAADYVVEDLVASGSIAEINVTEWPNGKNIEDDFIDPYFDKGRKYTSPYTVVYQALGLNPAVVTDQVTSWKDYFAAPASAAGKIGMHDTQSFVVDAALFAVGAKPCTTNGADYQRALDLLNTFKPSIKIISSDGTIDRLAGGEIVLSTMWNGSFARAQSQDPALKYVFPEEGFTYSNDNWAQLANAQNPDNAKIFMNWMLDPENAALNANYIKYSAPIKGIDKFLPAASEGNAPVMLPNAEELKRAYPLKPCAPEQKEQYDKLWTMFKG